MDKWGYQISVNQYNGEVIVNLKYLSASGESMLAYIVKAVGPPNWLERLGGITWKMKVNKARRELMKIAIKRITGLNDSIELADHFANTLEESDGQIR